MNSKVYVGPSIPGILPRFMVFSGDMPPVIEALARRAPSLCGLMVPVDRLMESRAEIEKKGTRLHTLRERLQKELSNQ